MTWYKSYYGRARDNTLTHLPITDNRKFALEQAHAIADKTRETVTIISERGTSRGLICETFQIKPV